MPTGTELPVQQSGGWTFRYRPSPAEDPRLLLLLHGWTGDEDSMWIFTPGIPPGYAILAPRAPYPDPEKGYSWRPMLADAWGFPELGSLKPAADSLVEFLGSFPDIHRFDHHPYALLGFSQGAAVSIALTILHPRLFSTVVALSGFLPGRADEYLRRGSLAGKEFLIAHGREDKLVPLDRAQQAAAWLREAGAKVTYCESDGGHKVSPDCRKAAEAFLADRLKS